MRKPFTIRRSTYSNAIAFACNILLVFITYTLCRVEFVMENWGMFADSLFRNTWSDLIVGSLTFDTSAILYTNMLYALMMLFPIIYKENDTWQRACKWVFMIFTSLCVIVNLADSVYFQYTGRRTTMSVFSEFSNENNMMSVMGTELARHWYLVIFAALLITALHKLYVKTEGQLKLPGKNGKITYHVTNTVIFIVYVLLTICGIRGGATTDVRPITISNANQYVNRPAEAAVILNTPFSMIRTIGKKTFTDPAYFSREELDSIYSPEHHPTTPGLTTERRNVVVLIVESFGREYIGKYNERLENGKYKGYTPFIDSLYSHCVSFDYTFCNGRKSIDGMPSILSGIPMFMEPFFLTSASLNEVSGLAGELKNAGYHSAFFHGADNGSMGFQAFARATGFDEYLGRVEYDEDKRFGGENDFDGTWAIWDEPFLQFYATKMSEMKEPFVTAVFTASSHHPFVVPEKYKDIYKDVDDNVIHKCIRYTDNALRRFFETSSKQDWFRNTLFVITSDHTNLTDHDEYKTDLGQFGAPILLYDPSGTLKPERRHCIAQQIDIMPTVLSYLGYSKPYVAFGKDLLTTKDEDTWAVNYNNGIYQYVKGHYLLQFDGEKTKAMYDIDNDWMLTKNIKGKTEEQAQMERELKAIIQSYMERMIEDRLTVKQ